jgi:trimethylamine--corrinoid protein Co-methyltransferase
MCLRLLDEGELAGLRHDVLARLAASGVSPGAVEAALASAPRSWTLAGRAAEDVEFGGAHTLLIAGGLATSVRDTAGAPARALTAASADGFCRLAAALPEVAVVEPPCVPGEAAAAARLTAVARAFAATAKHLLAVCGGVPEARAVVAMAALVAGGDTVRERPLVTIALMPGPQATEAALLVAEAGLPCLVAVAPSFFGAADRRVALAEAFADALTVAVAVQAARPGAAVGLAIPPGRRRPLDAGAFASVAAAAQLAGSFGLPLSATMLAAQAAAPDWLAATENTYAALTCALAGVAGLAGAGLLDGGASVSPHELVMDAEIFSYCAATGAGIAVNEETIALETIAKVGIAGNYLGERHTRRHMREVWRPRLFDRTPYEQWLREGRRQSYELADEFARRTLAEPPAQPLPADTAAALMALAQTAGKEIT